jgi:hypothetical protein
MISNPFEIVKFLDTEQSSLTSLQRYLAISIKSLYASEVKFGLNFPNSVTGNDEQLLLYETQSDIYRTISTNEFKEFKDNNIRVITFPEYKNLLNSIPIALVFIENGIDVEQASEIDILVRNAISLSIERINREIRQEIIVSKVNSNDLGSFLYRLIGEQKIHQKLSASHISIFVRDWIGQTLRLRGTSSSLRSDRRPSEIRFHSKDIAKRVVNCHMNGVPIFEFDETRNLSLNGDSHEIDVRGAWSRIYWPIRLSSETASKLRRAPDRNNDGIVRITNCIGMDEEALPFTWIHVSAIEFFCEALYIIVDAFSAADEASFKKDEAFHNSMSVIDTIAKNIETVSDTIFNPRRIRNEDRPPRFRLVSLKDNKHIDEDRIFQLLRTAYASARDIGFQIARANDDVPFSDRFEKTEFLIRDVILPALDLVPDMCVAHSATRGSDLPSITDMVGGKSFPAPVRGSAEALVSVFANLFENSVKYRKPGEIVKIQVLISDEANHVLVTVKDYGVGIREDEDGRIFNRGYRGSNAHEFAPRGSGLGLSWCEKVLRTFGGTISAIGWGGGLEIAVRLAKAK